ncbi:MAG: MFS transporter [Anaerolineales bacterium]|nr:MFS transporter [Anaerolineales bacterium]
MPVRLPAWLRWSAAPADASPLQRRNFINVQIDGVGVGLASASAPFIPVFLAHLGATNLQVGLLTVMPAVAGLLLSLAIGHFLQRQRNVVPWYGRARFLAILAYAATGLVTLVVPPAWAVNVTLLIWAAVTVPQIMTNVGFSVVMNNVAGPEGRYELMSRRWSVLGLTASLAVLLAGQVLEWLPFPLNFQVTFMGFSVGGLVSLIFSSRLELPPNLPLAPPAPARPLADRLRAARDLLAAHPAFLTFTGKRFVFLSGIALAAPIFPLYYVRAAQASDAAISLISTAGSVTLLIGYRFWTRLSQRRGSRLVLLCTTAGLALYPAFTAATQQVELLIALAALAGVFQAGLDLVFFDELMKTVPPEQTALFAALAQSLQNLSAVAAPLVGTLLADHVGLGGALLASAGLRLLAFGLFLRARPAA